MPLFRKKKDTSSRAPGRPWQKTLVFFLASQVIALGTGLVALEIFMKGASQFIRIRVPEDVAPVAPSQNGPGEDDHAAAFEMVAVGDSHTFGIGAPGGMSYPEQLARMIKRENVRVHPKITNLARPGMNSSEALSALRDHFRSGARPAAAVICVGTNNTHNLNFEGFLPDEIASLPTGPRLAHLLEKSGAYRLSKIARSRIEQLVRDGTRSTEWVGCVFCEEDEPFLIEWLDHDLSEMIRLSRRHDTAVILMTYHRLKQYIDRTMKKMAEREGVIFLSNFRFKIPFPHSRKPFVNDDDHPNEKGYARIAQNVLLALEKNDLIPGTEEKTRRAGRKG